MEGQDVVRKGEVSSLAELEALEMAAEKPRFEKPRHEQPKKPIPGNGNGHQQAEPAKKELIGRGHQQPVPAAHIKKEVVKKEEDSSNSVLPFKVNQIEGDEKW